jgi:AraC-like DNA-binding protein
LRNLSLTPDDLWGRQATERLLCLLADARTVDLKFEVLEQWLMQRVCRPLDHHGAVAFALRLFRSGSSLTGAEMADQAGLSQRRFIELFRNEVGFTPKQFSRLLRFRQTIRSLQGQVTADWIDLALSHGYFDQSHFIHEFQAFSGLTPVKYLGLRTPYINHLRVPD